MKTRRGRASVEEEEKEGCAREKEDIRKGCAPEGGGQVDMKERQGGVGGETEKEAVQRVGSLSETLV